MTEKRNRRTQAWFDRLDRDGFVHRSWTKKAGYPNDMFDSRPIIGICNTQSELTPCNVHFRELAEFVKRGVLEAGGVPLEFPVMSLGETQLRPTAMLFRNLASMAEALGISLPENAAIPAPDTRRNRLAQLTGRRIVRMVEENLVMSKILTREAFENLPNNRFNDGKCDARGRYWAGSVEFGCQEPVGSLHRLTPDRHCKKMDDGYAVTNGPTWSSDWKTMYFNDSRLGRVYAFDFDLDAGTISNKRIFIQFGPEDGSPDGMTTDAAGCLWIAHWAPGKVTRHDAEGQVLQTIDLPCNHVSSCTFGGPDLKTLYITSARVGLSKEQLDDQPQAGALFAIELDIAGVPADRFAG